MIFHALVLLIASSLLTTALLAAPPLDFWRPVETILTDQPPGGAASADFNDDGRDDLAISTPGAGAVAVWLGRADGTFVPLASYGVPPGSGDLSAADVNADGAFDLVVSSDGIAVLLGNGDGTFHAPIVSPGSARDCVLADFDRDGRLDIASIGANSPSVVPDTVDIYLGRSDGTFGPPATMYVSDRHPAALTAADVNGDGAPDLAFGERDSRQLRVMINVGGLSFVTASVTPIEVGPADIAAGDLDGNGTLDLVIANFTGTVSVLLGQGDGTWGSRSTVTMGDKCPQAGCPVPRRLLVADVNGDAHLDLLSANEGAPVTSIFVNAGPAVFEAPRFLEGGQFGFDVFATDANADGATDVLVLNANAAPADTGRRVVSTHLNKEGPKSRAKAAGRIIRAHLP